MLKTDNIFVMFCSSEQSYMESVVTFLQDVVPQVIYLTRVFSLYSTWKDVCVLCHVVFTGRTLIVHVCENLNFNRTLMHVIYLFSS